MGDGNKAGAGIQLVAGLLALFLWALIPPGPSSHAAGHPSEGRLARKILKDAKMDAVLRMAYALLKSGMTAGSGYSEVWIRDLNTFIIAMLDVAPQQSVREALLIFFHFIDQEFIFAA